MANTNHDDTGRFSSTGFGATPNPHSFSNPVESKTLALSDLVKPGRRASAVRTGGGPIASPLGNVGAMADTMIKNATSAARPSGQGQNRGSEAPADEAPAKSGTMTRDVDSWGEQKTPGSPIPDAVSQALDLHGTPRSYGTVTLDDKYTQRAHPSALGPDDELDGPTAGSFGEPGGGFLGRVGMFAGGVI